MGHKAHSTHGRLFADGERMLHFTRISPGLEFTFISFHPLAPATSTLISCTYVASNPGLRFDPL